MLQLKNHSVMLNTKKLFEIPYFKLDQGRFGLLAPNGSGKSVFMRQLYSKDINHNMNISYCHQSLSTSLRDKTLLEWVGNDNNIDINLYYRLAQELDLDLNTKIMHFSGGQERKAALIYALSQDAEIYFFDEPTNHLDINSIIWLENYLKNNIKNYIIISHDLHFLENLVYGYWAIHDGLLRYYEGNYSDYLQKREVEETALINQKNKDAISLKMEERYRERGVTARRKRNQKRLEKLVILRDKLKCYDKSNSLSFADLSSTSLSKKQIIIELKDYQATYFDEGKTILPPVSRLLSRGDRVAIVGENGRGKTTLVHDLVKNFNHPSLKHRDNLKFFILDQNRNLEEELTPLDLTSAGALEIRIETSDGIINMHPLSYLKRFGIDKDRASTKFKNLSGGEKMKVCLAKALLNPVDVLVLDEPTNDLDIEAIDEISELLVNFNTLILLVSHDRYFINQCATEVWYLTKNSLIIHPGEFDIKYLQNTPIANKKIEKNHNQVQKILKEIEKIEKTRKNKALLLDDVSLYLDERKNDLKKIKAEIADIDAKLELLYSEWDMLS